MRLRKKKARRMQLAGAELEGAMVASFEKAMRRLREKVQINEIAMAVATKNHKAAARAAGSDQVRNALMPSADKVIEAVLRGGRLAVELLNEEMGQ